nr:putative disease resistance protein rpp1 [Quercus suber]
MEGNDGLLLQTIQHLTALEELVLFNYNGDGMELEWQCLRKLQNLRLYDHPKLSSLPVGLQQATSLRNLKISNCPSLKTLPKWICNIMSLQSLEIWDCPNLTSLPGLMYLKTLTIWNCPILVESSLGDIGIIFVGRSISRNNTAELACAGHSRWMNLLGKCRDK